MNYYNEWDPQAAAWLRELIKAGHIPQGIVDERSITEVTPADLAGFTQVHFFAGIAGWSRALQLAGVPATVPLWTGSPPCQPFSVAGAQVGFDDPRHLAPALLELIAQCRPPVVFGEQVSAAIGKHWLDFIFLDLEAEGYTCGAAVLPAASVGAPHLRERLFFGAGLAGYSAGNVAHLDSQQWHGSRESGTTRRAQSTDRSPTGELGHLHLKGLEIRSGQSGAIDVQERRCDAKRPGGLSGVPVSNTDSDHGDWKVIDWIGCRDNKYRPIKPGIEPLVDGFPNRVAALRGAGNAIVPQAAAAFIKAFLG